MFWVDETVQEIEKTFPGKKRFIIRDEKTPSGRVHIGSLRGVVIHGIIVQALKEKGYDAEFYFEINDADPMDGLPVYLDEKTFRPHMGKPLKDVPPPDAKSESYARYFGDEFVEVINRLGFFPKIIYASDLYKAGRYNKLIDIVLRFPDRIREIYLDISGSKKAEDWNPLQIVCEKCGKVGTTKVTGWNEKLGEAEATYTCERNMVKWAEGCGYSGKVSPYNGRGKLPWKVEWPAKWIVMNVDIEGAGKDHNAAGGSREIGDRITKEIFRRDPPFNIPYEFFLFGGAKMSSSKGLGASAKEVSDTLPPELLRFLMVRTWPNQPIDFNPEGDTIPRLYDHYDEAAQAYFHPSEETKDLQRIFHFSQMHAEKIVEHFMPRLYRVAFSLQLPHLKYEKEMEKMKGSPLTKEDIEESETRKKYALEWLEKYAPEHHKWVVQSSLPEAARLLSTSQKEFLRSIADILEKNPSLGGEKLHGELHALRKSSPLDAREAFKAIYIVLLGKDSGPQAGWFLEALDRKFVIERFHSV